MFDQKSRQRKAIRMIKTIQKFLNQKDLSHLELLDIGSSTGIIDYQLAQKFGKVCGIDIDSAAINFAKKRFKKANLIFKKSDGLKLNFPTNSFDVVICTHIYEHVTNPQLLMREIYRVLKPGGLCYFAAINRLWPIEPHYDLPFLSWLPKSLANRYTRMTKKATQYYESPLSYWGLKKLTNQFKRFEYTQQILKNPAEFGYEDSINSHIKVIACKLLSPLSKYLAPTFFWVLVKS